MLRLSAPGLEIVLREDADYRAGSDDGRYGREHVLARGHTEAIGIEVAAAGSAVGSAVVIVPMGSPGVHERCAMIRDDSLVLACGGEVVAFSLPGLDLLWRAEADPGCIFGLHPVPGEQAVIAHGEQAIARVEPDGTVAWMQWGEDIFSGELHLRGDAVEVIDWNGEAYRFHLADGTPLS
jgi:hypothetical protein